MKPVAHERITLVTKAALGVLDGYGVRPEVVDANADRVTLRFSHDQLDRLAALVNR